MLSYADILELFWQMHNAERPAFSQQYKSAVFYQNAEQERLAREVKARMEQERGVKLATDILPAGQFYLAEDYHQKYYLRQQRDLAAEFTAMYPDWRDFAFSTAAARANGFVGGYGEADVLEREIGDYGLSEPARQHLRQLAGSAQAIACGS